MLSMARSKIFSKKAQRSTAVTFKSCTSVCNNPEITIFVDKLNELTEDINQSYDNPLNMIEWQINKYNPNQSENRIRIQNQIYLKKAGSQTVRPKIKPIKRQSKSVQLYSKEMQIPYKEHYFKLLDSFKLHKGSGDDLESEEDNNLIDGHSYVTQPSGFYGYKYYERLRKYKKITTYIEQKMKQKQQNSKNKLKINRFSMQINEIKEPQIIQDNKQKEKKSTFEDQYRQYKIESIVKKWKPQPKIQRKFKSASQKINSYNRFSSKRITKSNNLNMTTYSQQKTKQRRSNYSDKLSRRNGQIK